MRRALIFPCATALVLLGCGGGSPSPDAPLPTLTATGGPENVLLRITTGGGFPRSYRWPNVEVAAWTGTERLPEISRVLGFDDVSGQLSIVDSAGRAGQLDLRTGRAVFTEQAIVAASSPDGASLYGIDSLKRVWRLAQGAEWSGPSTEAESLFALRGGNVILVSSAEDETHLVRVRPPSEVLDDTIAIPTAEKFVATPTGDRLFALTSRGVMTVDVRGWQLVSGPRTRGNPLAIAPTPSGDRVFVLEPDGRAIRVWERFAERFDARVVLPKPASDIRMDAMGRFVLARMDLVDSAFVVSVPMVRVTGVVPTEWRGDLPMFTPDGALLTLRGNDVHLIDAVTASRRRRIRGGALDTWVFVRWDGFKPRDSSLDQPAIFEMDPPIDSVGEAEKIDSILAARAEIAARETLDSIARATAGGRARGDSATLSYTLSFASLLSESAARSLASRIRVDGRPPRIVAGTRDGITIYRVVMGPFASREEAEAAGRRSGMPFWVFAGLP